MTLIARVRSSAERLLTRLVALVGHHVLVDAIDLSRAGRRIRAEILSSRESFDSELQAKRAITHRLSIDDLRRHISAESDRRRSVDDKAKANLTAITVGFAVLLGSVNFLGRPDLQATIGPLGAKLAWALLVLGVGYLVFGGLKAIEALEIEQSFSLSPQDEADNDEEARKAMMLWSLEQNQRVTLLRTNAVSVSHKSIRNGVVCLALLTALVAGRSLSSS
ncbi:MAG: hypothetical protein K2X35_03440 [Bryobacteraceae bacterium]|nr:hypothetical protein [Bryobacteraceae bacterium]